MRGYELIYPCKDKLLLDKYEKLLQKSNDIFDEFTTGKGTKLKLQLSQPHRSKKIMSPEQSNKVSRLLPPQKVVEPNITQHLPP